MELDVDNILSVLFFAPFAVILPRNVLLLLLRPPVTFLGRFAAAQGLEVFAMFHFVFPNYYKYSNSRIRFKSRTGGLCSSARSTMEVGGEGRTTLEVVLVGFELVLKWQFHTCVSRGMEAEGAFCPFLIGWVPLVLLFPVRPFSYAGVALLLRNQRLSSFEFHIRSRFTTY